MGWAISISLADDACLPGCLLLPSFIFFKDENKSTDNAHAHTRKEHQIFRIGKQSTRDSLSLDLCLRGTFQVTLAMRKVHLFWTGVVCRTFRYLLLSCIFFFLSTFSFIVSEIGQMSCVALGELGVRFWWSKQMPKLTNILHAWISPCQPHCTRIWHV